jgi:hypothetical protein
MHSHSIAWAAGLFEGEGCIQRQRLRIEMTDKDVLEMFADIFPGGHWYERQRQENWKRTYTYTLSKQSLVRDALSTMLSYFGNRRAYAALNILDDLELTL